MKFSGYCTASDMWLLVLLGAVALALNACEQPRPHKDAVDWQHIDYEEIACGSEHIKPGCHTDHDVDAVGKGRSSGRR